MVCTKFLISLSSFLIIVHCAASCSQQEFKCKSSKCIPRHLMCNDEDDCGDSSDEINCTNRKKCGEGDFECIDAICIPSELVCNGRMDCPRGLDEINCGTSSSQTTTSSIAEIQGSLRTADGGSVISFPIFHYSAGFRIYLRFIAYDCIGHLLEISSQNTDEFFLLSLSNDGIHFIFKSTLGPGLITIPTPAGESFCNGKRYLLTIKRNLDEIWYRVNRGRSYKTRNKILAAPFQQMNIINVGFGLKGCVSGFDMLYYRDGRADSHSVGVTKGCVLTKKSTPKTSTRSTRLLTLKRAKTTTSTRNRIRKQSELHYSRLISMAPTVRSTITQSATPTNQRPSITIVPVTDDVTHSTRATTRTKHLTAEVTVAMTELKRDISTTNHPTTQGMNLTTPPIKICTPLPPLCTGSGLQHTTSLRSSMVKKIIEYKIRQFLPFIRANCSIFLRTFLCAFHFPSCSQTQSTATQPCRELCLETKHECSSLMNAFEFNWPESLNCNKLPSTSQGTCYMPQPLIAKITPEINSSKGCGGMLKHAKGIIKSPNYPRPYPPDMLCQWAIVLPKIYRVINLLIEEASLESDAHCGYDYILFRDGLSNQVGAKFCGFLEYPRLITVKGNIAVVVFRSDSLLNKKGILIKYEAHWK